MPRQLLAIQALPHDSNTPLPPSYVAATAGGEEFINDTFTFLHIKNSGGSDREVTVVHPGTQDGLEIADYTATIPTGGEIMTRTFNNRFNQAGGIKVHIDWDDHTGLTVAAISVRRF